MRPVFSISASAALRSSSRFAYYALVLQQVLEFLQFVFAQYVVAVYIVELTLQFHLGACFVQTLAVLCVGKTVFKVVGATQIVQLLLRQIHFAT